VRWTGVIIYRRGGKILEPINIKHVFFSILPCQQCVKCAFPLSSYSYHLGLKLASLQGRQHDVCKDELVTDPYLIQGRTVLRQ
jgi:hypothetical protein